jgi:glucose/arabinose dehydrogenase
MLGKRALGVILFIMLGLLSSCGGGGGGGGGTPVPQQGALALTITGLPAGVAAQVSVTGPGGFSRAVTASQTLAALTPGSYVVAAQGTAGGGLSYTPAPASQTVAVTAGGTGAASVAYSVAALTLALTEVASVPGAVFAAAPPGDTRLFIVERAGRIRIVQGGALLATPFLDISSRVSVQGEGGLLSIAFHPQYASNGLLFLYYTDPANNIVIERHRASGNANLAEAGNGLEIIHIAHPTFTNHFGGLVSFGPDGMLYLGTGDGGGGGDPSHNAQSPFSLLGKLLRLDVAASTAIQPYTIPPTNPWVNDAGGRRAEIWALGLRNPWRYAFDSNNLYIADVGQDQREEIDVAAASQGGLNYGWNTMEGTQCYNASTCVQTGLVLPVFEYVHGTNDVNGCSITGGYVYRGTAIAELAGRYFYSDYCKGFLKSVTYAGGVASGQTDWAIPAVGNVVSFGRDGANELLIISASGKVNRIVRGN